jgi:hypothetical protein
MHRDVVETLNQITGWNMNQAMSQPCYLKLAKLKAAADPAPTANNDRPESLPWAYFLRHDTVMARDFKATKLAPHRNLYRHTSLKHCPNYNGHNPCSRSRPTSEG